MIIIKDKKDSVTKMQAMGLNTFPMAIFNVNDRDSIKKFFDQNKAQSYIMRNPNRTKSKFYFVSNYDEALKKLRYFKDEVNIDVSFNEFKDSIVLLGDIKISRGGLSDTVDLTARDDCDATHRNIYENPTYNLHTSLDDDKLWDIPGFAKIAKYIADHELYDVIVEFVVYDGKFGVKKENVVIVELRTGF